MLRAMLGLSVVSLAALHAMAEHRGEGVAQLGAGAGGGPDLAGGADEDGALAVLLGDALQQRGQLVGDAGSAEQAGQLVHPENERGGVAVLAADPAPAHVGDVADKLEDGLVGAGGRADEGGAERGERVGEAIVGGTGVGVADREAGAVQCRLAREKALRGGLAAAGHAGDGGGVEVEPGADERGAARGVEAEQQRVALANAPAGEELGEAGDGRELGCCDLRIRQGGGGTQVGRIVLAVAERLRHGGVAVQRLQRPGDVRGPDVLVTAPTAIGDNHANAAGACGEGQRQQVPAGRDEQVERRELGVALLGAPVSRRAGAQRRPGHSRGRRRRSGRRSRPWRRRRPRARGSPRRSGRHRAPAPRSPPGRAPSPPPRTSDQATANSVSGRLRGE